MAIRIPNQHPLDINKRVAVGVSIPFNGISTNPNNSLFSGSTFPPPAPQGNSVFNSTYTTIDQIKSNVINYILTNKGERVLNPNFGSNLRNFIFENLTETNLRTLEIKLSNDISSNFPSVNVQSVILTPAYESNAVQLDITYSIYGSEAQNIQITF
jgi:phage baseplate assembly protein W